MRETARATPSPAAATTPGLEAPINIAYFLVTWVAAAFASSLVILAFGRSDGDTPIATLAASLSTGWLVYAVGAWVTSRQIGSRDVRADVGVSFARVDLLGVVVGVVTQLALVRVVYVPLRAIWPATFTEQALRETAEDLVERARSTSDLMLVVLALVVVLGAPVFEELVYRGLLQRPLLQKYSPGLVVVGVAVLFALIHFRPVEYPGLFVAGLVFGLCAWRTGRLGMGFAAHLAFNAVGLVMAL